MTFLQPWVLVALPLAALPVIIHLINQRRFQTVPWAAMQFLLAAKALSRGYSRLRHWLILLLRMLAVAAVILAVGRPLSRGWLALAGGGRPDSAIVVLDRSPSMQAVATAGGEFHRHFCFLRHQQHLAVFEVLLHKLCARRVARHDDFLALE